MPPLVAKWQSLADSDRDLLPLLECFTAIAPAIGETVLFPLWLEIFSPLVRAGSPLWIPLWLELFLLWLELFPPLIRALSPFDQSSLPIG